MKKTWFYLIILFTVFACQKEDTSIIGWEKQTNNLVNNTTLDYLAVSGSNIYSVTDNLKNTLYKSFDGGINWIEVSSIPKKVNSITLWNQYVFAGTSAGIYRSSDNGVTWTAINNGLPLLYGNVETGVPFECGNNIYAYYGYRGDVYKAENNGESWTRVTGGLNIGTGAFTIIGTTFISGTYKGVYHSDDGGTTWTAAIKDKADIETFSISGTNVVGGASNGLYYSIDNGTNWIQSKITDEDYQSVSIRCFAVSGKNIYAGTETFGIYFSSDNGINWSKFNTGLTNTLSCYSLFVSGENLYARTSRGLWKRQL